MERRPPLLFQMLLNVSGNIDHEAMANIKQRITWTSLDDIPTMDEMARVIASLKDGKAPGGEFLLKYGSTEEHSVQQNAPTIHHIHER